VAEGYPSSGGDVALLVQVRSYFRYKGIPHQ